jgi:hypothetical protein
LRCVVSRALFSILVGLVREINGGRHKGIRNLGSGRSDPYTNSETLLYHHQRIEWAHGCRDVNGMSVAVTGPRGRSSTFKQRRNVPLNEAPRDIYASILIKEYFTQGVFKFEASNFCLRSSDLFGPILSTGIRLSR